MKTRKSSPHDELKGIDFIPIMKSKKKDASNIGDEDSKVKLGIEDLMTALFRSLAEIHKLQMKAREGRDG